jgi:hypothetical protein
MLSKLNLAAATAFSGLTGVFTGIYVHHNSVKTNEEFAQRELERKKELIQFKHDLELERIDYNYLTNLLNSETLLNKVSELKDEGSSLLNQPSISTGYGSLAHNPQLGKDSVESVTKALLAAGPRPVACPGGESNSVNVQESNLFSVLEHLPLPVTANQHFAFSFFMFNMTVLICLTGLILNHYSKLYGDQYLEKLPKWILPIAKHYSNLRDYSNNYYILTIFVTTIMSTLGSMILYYLG